MKLLPEKLTESSLLSYLHKESTFKLRRITNLLPSVEVTFQVPCEIIFLVVFYVGPFTTEKREKLVSSIHQNPNSVQISVSISFINNCF